MSATSLTQISLETKTRRIHALTKYTLARLAEIRLQKQDDFRAFLRKTSR